MGVIWSEMPSTSASASPATTCPMGRAFGVNLVLYTAAEELMENVSVTLDTI